MISTEETDVVGTATVLLIEQGKKLQHELIVGHVALREHTLDFFEIPLWKPQCLNVIGRPPHVPILAIWPINTEATPVVVALATDCATWVITIMVTIIIIDTIVLANCCTTIALA